MKKNIFVFFLFAVVALGWRVSASTFTSAGPINFANLGTTRTSSPYPSTVAASGIPAGTITSVKVTLNNLTHPRPPDIEILLVSPWGAKLVIMADVSGVSFPVSGINLTMDDAAASLMPTTTGTGLATGSYKPTCVDVQNSIATDFPTVSVISPTDAAFPRGAATFTSVFGGSHDPNGTWSLYIIDDSITSDNASIGSWTLDVTTSVASTGTTTTIGSSSSSSATGASVTFTATVKKQTDASAVTSGTVTFREGASTLSANVALNGSGQATFTTSALTEGDHTISADYNPGSGFLASTTSANQRVDNATSQTGNTFSNTGALSVPSSGAGIASVYPSRIVVSGLSGSISKVTLSLSGLSVDRFDDVELLLVGPGGQTFALLGDAGGTLTPVSSANFTFDDAAASLISDATAPAAGTYKPSSYDALDDSGSAPASGTALTPPAGPYSHPAGQGSSTFATVFAGIVPNGTWSLYLYDDVVGGGIAVAGGWSLTFTTTSDAPTTVTVTSTPNPSTTGSSVTVTAAVKKTSDSTAVTTGTVTFKEGTTVLAGPLALNGSGQASFSTSALVEGSHTITADYNGSPGTFNVSSGSTSQGVENATVVTGNMFCNPGNLTVSATAPSLATVYPSHVLVSGLTGPMAKVTLTLKGLSIDRPDDLELLLVSPSGAKFVPLSDAGGTATAASGIDLVLDDSAGSQIPDAGPMAAGTFRPTSVNNTDASFPSPAPGGPYTHAGPFGAGTFASVFNGADPNGTWSLYVQDDVSGGGATIANGWCLTIDTLTAVTGVSATTANGSYKTGASISIAVGFSKVVNVSGFPKLQLNSGGSAFATYAGGSGTSTLTFTYPVGAGENSADLDYLSASALTLNGGAIADTFGNNAVLTLPNPGTAGSLGANSAVVIDTTVPAAPLFTSITTDTGSSPTDQITSDTTLLLGGTAEADSTVNVTRVGVGVIGTTTTSAGGVWSFDYTGTPLVEGTHSFTAIATDAADNSSVISSTFNVTVDTTRPGTTISAPSTTATSGGSVTFTVTYSDPNFEASTLNPAFDISLNPTGNASGIVNVTGTGNTRTVTISSFTGDGTLGISIGANTATDFAGNGADAAGPSATFVVDTTNDAPTIAGAVAAQAVNDNGTITPFNAVVIGDTDQPGQTLSVTVNLDAAKGDFSTLNGFTSAGGGSFTFSGVAADATAAIQGLVYDPTDNRVQPGLTDTNTLVIIVNDGHATPVTNDTTTVIATSINDAPIAGADSIQRHTGKPVKVSITQLLSNDSDPEAETLALSLPSNSSANGASVAIEGGWVIYSAPVSDAIDTFQYTVSDGSGGSNPGTVTVTVQDDQSQSQNILSVVVDGSDRVITFAGIAGFSYRIQYTDDLGSPAWATLSAPQIVGGDGISVYRDVAPPSLTRFYRTISVE